MKGWLWVSIVAAFALVVTAPATRSELAPSAMSQPVSPISSDQAWVNIRSTGARGDGAADDTSAVQAALRAAAVSRRPIFCPAGTYRVSSSLTLGSDLVGSPSTGQAACVIKYVGPGPAVLVTANPVTISSVVLDLTGNTNTNTGGILVPQLCELCVFASISVTGPPNRTVAYLDYGIKLSGGGGRDRFTQISTFFATSAIITGVGNNHLYQSTFENLFAQSCGQMRNRACLEINGAVDTVVNSGLGARANSAGAPTLNTVLITGSDAEAIDIIATELYADAPNGTAVVIRRPRGDVNVATLIDTRLPGPSRLVSDVVTPPRLTRIATQESGNGPVGFVGVAAPAATFLPLSGVTLDACTCTAVAGTITFHTGRAAPVGPGAFGTINFNHTYPSVPIVMLTPNTQSAAAAGFYVDSPSTTDVDVSSTRLVPNTRYVVSYHVIEQ